MTKPTKKLFFKTTLVILVLTLAVTFMPFRAVQATDTIGGPIAVIKKALDKVEKKMATAFKKISSTIFQTLVSNALKRIAYDLATYAASGDWGQKSFFPNNDPSQYAADLADSAAGDFIDAFAKETNFNFCQPNLDVKVKIGLGLNSKYSTKIPDSSCKASTMFKAWKTNITEKYKSLTDPHFLQNLAKMFDPNGSDISMALDVMSGMDVAVSKKTADVKNDLLTSAGWTQKKNIGGQTTDPPGTNKLQLETSQVQLQEAQKVSVTESVLTDAGKVFLNTLATTAFNRALKNIMAGDWSALTYGLIKDKSDKEITDMIVSGGSSNSSTANPSCLDDPNCDPSTLYGASAVKNTLSDMIKPSFDSRGDYDILGQLSVCTDPLKPGPTDCILDAQFSSAISEQKTVIEAITDGSLNKTWRLKRDIDFNQGYSLRSLMVLRKFRIVPVGWETALLKAEENNANVTLMDMVSCFDPNDNYNEFSQGFVPSTWCQGLIDPNWVLKAPMNYCKRQGFGNQILDKTVTPSQNVGGVEVPGELILTRADEYCADEQSCIKEKTDGTCEAYGYCTEEKRTWDFTSDSCDPIYNTCETFIKPSGVASSYLQNTLDYATCNTDNAGCKPYSVAGSYATTTDTIAWNSLHHIYFSKKVEPCDRSQEGCNEVIRITPEVGHNFLINSDFESPLEVGSWNVNTDSAGLSSSNIATSTAGGYFSNTALSAGGLLQKNVAVGPNDYNISGRTYTFSFYAKNCVAGDLAVIGGSQVDDKTISLGESSDWSYYNLAYTFPLGLTDNHVYISISSAACQLDRLKLELSQTGTEYSNYYEKGLAYQKLIPDYLATTCYVNPTGATPDYRLKSNAPGKCSSYTRRCNAAEVDCDLYKSVRDNFVLPAKTTPFDACFAECDGYDSYIQKATTFQNPTAANFIPSTAVACTADAVGCTEFTNLDTVNLGGEGREYYSFLRQCIKPDNNACGVFYSWGSAGSGYELQPFKLQAFADHPILTVGNFAAAPGSNYHVIDGATVCDEAIFNASASDSAYNPDCRQLYNKDGLIYYVLYSKTITCSEDCHPYRISDTPIDETITDPNDCTGTDKSWSASTTACFVCKNGGVWDSNQNGCIYQAIPGEGKTCSAAQNGCREYNGNFGNTLRIINSYEFELNKIWGSYCNDSTSLSNESINKNGHSLAYTYAGGTCGTPNFNLDQIVVSKVWKDSNFFVAISNLWDKIVRRAEAQTGNALPGHGVGITVGHSVKQNSAYVVRFLAKATANTTVNVYLANGSVAAPFAVTSQNNGAVNITGNNEWKLYTMNLAALDHEVSDQEALLFSASGSLLIDNVVITEVTDRFYLIKDSWVTPNSCYYDTFNEYQGTNYNLGCSAYTNRGGQTSYLRNFSHLCSDSSAGCELMALTNNSADPGVQAFQETGLANNQCDGGDGASCVEVPADKMVYVVYDETKQCDSSNKGCSRLGGLTVSNTDITVQNLYSDVYVKNNPDKYTTSLCNEAEVGCDEFKSVDGQSSFFRDPGENVCEWRQPLNASGMNLPKKWYKRAIKRCDFNHNGKIDADLLGNITESQNKLCAADSDCGAGVCILDKNDYLCVVDSLKTIGLGGGNLVYQPKTMTGACDARSSTCTEYVDPVSEFSPNVVVNPGWGDLNKDGIFGDGWSTSTIGSLSLQKQTIYLQKNKLYSFSVDSIGATYDTILSCPASVRVLLSDNSFDAVTNTITIGNTVNSKNILFNSLNNVSCSIYGARLDKTINIRGTIVDYKLLAGVDKTTCNGAASFDAGCIMFNERRQAGGNGLSQMNWKAFGGSYTSGQPITPNIASEADSNVLVKVKPNRICSKWLSCLSMGVDPTSGEETCYALGECDKLNDFGRCQSFVIKPETQHTFDSGSDRNIAGYAKMNNYYLSNMAEVGEDLRQNWGFDNPSAPEFISNTINKIVTSSDDMINGIDYPAVGKGLASINTSVQLASFLTYKNKDYFINFLINIDAAGGDGGKLAVSGSGATSTSVLSGSGWQRKVLKFTPTVDGVSQVGLINLSSGPNSRVYFDDINIEPVLKVAADTYVPKECRLYPKDDSLSCKSENTGVTPNGIYGYCLEHDPKNQDVCIMWYPIDNVKSSQASVGTFSGYASKPKYCAQVDVNFAFVEKRSSYIAFDGETNSSCGACSSCPDNSEFTSDGNSAPWAGITCGSSDYWLYVSHIKSCSGTKHVHTCAICYPKDDSSSRVASISGPTLTCSNSTGYSYTFGNNGWYIFNGFNGTESSNATPNVQLWDYADTGAGVQDPVNYTPKCSLYVESDTAWVKRVTSLVPSTSTIPFINPAYLTASNPFRNYNKSNYLMDPYGAAENPTPDNYVGDGKAGSPYSCNGNGRTYRNSAGTNGVNICNALYAKNTSYSEFGARYDTPVMGMTQTATIGTPASALKILKNYFLNFEWNGITYDYTNGLNVSVADKIPYCNGDGSSPRPAENLSTAWCSVFPTVNSGIKLRDSEGHVVPFDSNTGYAVGVPGYYTLTFGVTVDPEQLPVGKLVVDFGDGTGNLTTTQIDPNTNYNFLHYYNVQSGISNYKIRIKVQDNWGLYGWSGLPASGGNCLSPFNCAGVDFNPSQQGPGGACEGCL